MANEWSEFCFKNSRALSLSEGDYLALMSAGAYGFTMSSNYNTRPRVAEVMVANATHQLVRKRETVQECFHDQ
jgi:diaminopimelate decarboxylase